jgi:hypothetical protein
MQILKIVPVVLVSLFVTGCATKSLSISDNDKTSFYSPPSNSMSSVYLTCGRNAKNGDYDSPLFPVDNRACDFAINGKKYSQINDGQVGRVDIPNGSFSINNSGGLEETRQFDIKANEKILFVSDRNVVTQTGAAFGLIGLAAGAIADSINPPPKPILFPLIVYKNDFMDKINMKEPVKVFVLEDK